MQAFKLFLVLCLTLTSATGWAKGPGNSGVVDCDRKTDDNGKLQDTIDKVKPGETVSVTGTCEGIALVISRSAVTLQGPATLAGTGAAPVVRVQDSGDVNLFGLDISGGTVGVEVDNARVNAAGVSSNNNGVDGFSVIQNGALTCTDCQANNNGDRGMQVIGNMTLCGNNELRDNANSGALIFLGGRVFSAADVCGAPVSLSVSGNPNGIVMFQQGVMYMAGADLNVTAPSVAMNVLDSSLTAVNSNVTFDGSGVLGLNILNSSTVRLNDGGLGTTSIQNNLLGVIVSQNSSATLGNATVVGNIAIDVQVQDFSNANTFGVSTVGTVSCEPGQSSGNVCP